MKFRSLLPLVALVFAVAYACTDTSAPVRSNSLMAPTELDGVLGKPPPPPVSTVIYVDVQSPGVAVFTGVFFSNGQITDDRGGKTSWLRLDNKQPDVLGFSLGRVSANARFMAKGTDFSGHGTLFIEDIAYTITDVDLFVPEPDCGDPEVSASSPCAVISFTAEDEAGNEHTGRAIAFDRETCLQETKKGDLIFVCEPDIE